MSAATLKKLEAAIAANQAAQDAARHAVYMHGTDFHYVAAVMAAADVTYEAERIARDNHSRNEKG
jgi:hypothetical protein